MTVGALGILQENALQRGKAKGKLEVRAKGSKEKVGQKQRAKEKKRGVKGKQKEKGFRTKG